MGDQQEPTIPADPKNLLRPDLIIIQEEFKASSGMRAQINYIFSLTAGQVTGIDVDILYDGPSSETDRLEATERAKVQLRQLNPDFKFHVNSPTAAINPDLPIVGQRGEA